MKIEVYSFDNKRKIIQTHLIDSKKLSRTTGELFEFDSPESEISICCYVDKKAAIIRAIEAVEIDIDFFTRQIREAETQKLFCEKSIMRLKEELEKMGSDIGNK